MREFAENQKLQLKVKAGATETNLVFVTLVCDEEILFSSWILKNDLNKSIPAMVNSMQYSLSNTLRKLLTQL